MSWICVRCSERSAGGSGPLGFGLCKKCQETVKMERAEKLNKNRHVETKTVSAVALNKK